MYFATDNTDYHINTAEEKNGSNNIILITTTVTEGKRINQNHMKI